MYALCPVPIFSLPEMDTIVVGDKSSEGGSDRWSAAASVDIGDGAEFRLEGTSCMEDSAVVFMDAAHVADSTWLYMCVVAALDQDGGSRCRRRVGIFFAWNVLDGSFHTLRLVSVPLHTPLSTASDAMLRRCRRAISSIQATTHPLTTCSNSSWSSSVPSFNMWTNAGVLCGTSVGRLDNPVWPYAISR
ncbi:hypothetical protein DYB37_009987 [Aphanomyces astaci]|uniref:Uncharacterized protein n=1 Tax=Aphanomyces astaci TaxID=112090 RepID=A0A3R6ZCC5_APHAT|nr:hypothetical protein DYB35_008835 [Aphanomyces astaci]RHZ10698.1 hypothetical protein DYB37_009987 [Aphanomyces astaci]